MDASALDVPVKCHVCGGPLGKPCYRSARPVSITSLCEVQPRTTTVNFCAGCGHLQTETPPDAAAYYDHDYKILVDSEEEDQLYAEVAGGGHDARRRACAAVVARRRERQDEE